MHETDDAAFEDVHLIYEAHDAETSALLYHRWQQAAIDQYDPSNDTAWQRQQLRAATDAAIAGRFDTDQQRTLEDVHTLINYWWFGGGEADRPDTLITGTGMWPGETIMTVDPERLSTPDLNASIGLLKQHGLDSILAHRTQLLDAQAERTLLPMAQAMVRNTPGYRLLESFIGDIQLTSEQPLNVLERLIREQQAEQYVRRRHGLTPDDPLTMHPQARRDLGRGIARLDEETVARTAAVPEDRTPSQVATDFIWGTASDELRERNAEYGAQWGVIDGTEIRSMTGDQHAIRIETDTQTIQWLPMSFYTWAAGQQDIDVPLQETSRYITEDIITRLAAMVVSGQLPATLQNMLSDSVTNYSRMITESLQAFATLEPGWNPHNLTKMLTLLYQPTETEREIGAFMIIPYRPDVFRSGPNEWETLLSHKELKKQLKATAMHVRKRPSHDTEARILYLHMAPEQHLYELERDGALVSFADADLILDTKKDWQQSHPKVAPGVYGYRLVNGDFENGRFAYQYLPDADPYARCDVLIPPAGQQALAERYTSLGLAGMAEQVANAGNLTVADLTAIIKANGQYYTGNRTLRVGDFENWDSFKPLIHDGQLTMQCVGWSRFLGHSLHEIFGSCGNMSGGLLLQPRGTRVTRVGHAQFRFVDPATRRQYMLDATPAGGGLESLRDSINKQWDSIRRRLGSAATKQLISPPQPPAERPPRTDQNIEPVFKREVTRGAALQANAEVLYTNLRMMFGRKGQLLSHEDLSDAIATRGPDDLLFRAVATIRATEREEASAATEATRLLNYLERLAGCDDPAILRQLDPHGYVTHPWLADSLAQTLNQARRLLQPDIDG